MQRDGRHFQLALQGAPVEAFDVAQLVDVAAAACVDLAGRHRPKHERIIRVRAVRDVDGPGGRRSPRHDDGFRGFCACRSA